MNQIKNNPRNLNLNKLNLHFNTQMMTYKDPEMEEKYGTIFLFI